MPETPRVAKQHRCKFQKQNNTICNAGFHRAEHLKRHMTSHSNVRPFPCPLPNCKGRIGRSDNALDHFMTHLREKTKKKRNAHSTLEQIEQHLRGHPAWEDKKIDKMIEHLHRRLALEQQKARVAAAKKERELAMEDFHGKRLSRL
ncbi:hypothetical protein CERZMDRAFT_109339 [Cercospora zeae-maydis SCOH1-5]|uniref:C2H2-type domain-containing protein n=1 Tax=Cercospora zeae-maydis SCOH1-5 TaxID=717836 RepID=A0A6A6FSU0_9PEZI|nr:hypothetical protein CERZMDRAFT_109339 [Cercospora zeae-maydis SCOH1-5]